MMPADELAAIRAREAAATPPPWKATWSDDDPEDVRVCCMGPDPREPTASPVCISCLALSGDWDAKRERWEDATIQQWRADAIFLANARTDIPRLLTDHDALVAENARLRHALVGLMSAVNCLDMGQVIQPDAARPGLIAPIVAALAAAEQAVGLVRLEGAP